MTSGMPFHEDEITFVEENMKEYPSILARSLGLYYPQHNGGSRCTKSVSRLMNKIRTGRAPNSLDTLEDEVIEPNTRMQDLPPVAKIPAEPVAAIPAEKVAEIGTKTAEPPVAKPEPAVAVTKTPQTRVHGAGNKKRR